MAEWSARRPLIRGFLARGGAAGGLNRKARRAAVAKARTKAKWLH